jgi:3-hydroxyacyl-CoA dehydrogenase
MVTVPLPMSEVQAASIATTTVSNAVALIRIDSPPVNALGHAVRCALFDGVRAALADVNIKAIVIACGGRMFFAGADITELGKPMQAPLLRDIFQLIEASPVPVVAAIHGSALGGGLELALACHCRVAVSTAKLGLPEVALGLMPGAGGTQRVPRLVGIGAAIEFITFGKPMDAEAASRAGLLDEVIYDDTLEAGAIRFAQGLIARESPLRRVRDLDTGMGADKAFALAVNFRTRHPAMFKGFKAPEAILQAIVAAASLPFDQGLEREAELSRALLASRESRAQRHMFFAERAATKLRTASSAGASRPIRTVAIAGATARARDIATSFRAKGVTAIPINPDGFAPGDLVAIGTADLIIEASAGGFVYRCAQLRHIRAAAQPAALLVSAADACELDQLTSSLGWGGAALGLQFHPATGAPGLVEVVRTRDTEDTTVLAVLSVAVKLATAVIVINPDHASVAGRLALRLRRAATALMEQGVTGAEIAHAMYAFGPAALQCLDTLRNGDRDGGTSLGDTLQATFSEEEIFNSIAYAMVDEAAKLGADGSVTSGSDIDVAAVHALDWPAYWGGPLFWGAEIGFARIVKHLDDMNGRCGALIQAVSPELRQLARRTPSEALDGHLGKSVLA